MQFEGAGEYQEAREGILARFHQQVSSCRRCFFGLVTYPRMPENAHGAPVALARFQPDFFLYNAGSDVLRTDPLGGLLLTPQEMAERDLYVVTEVRSQGIPLAMVLSGGYGPCAWEAHARSLEGLLARFDRQILS